MGEVYLAEDTKLRRQVALKFLPAELTRDESRKRRFIHTRCLVSRGVWDAQGQWLPLPYIDTVAVENVISFITEHKVIRKILSHLENRKRDSRAPPQP